MGSAGHSCGSPSGSYGSTNVFAAPSGRSMAKNGNFLKAVGNASTNSHTVEPQQIEKSANCPVSLGINLSEQSSFDFSPLLNTESPLHKQSQFDASGGAILGWGSDMNFLPLSPPNSASPFSKDWNYGFQSMSNPSNSNIFSNTQPNTNARAQYGQVTPPDDEYGDGSLLDYQLHEQQQEPNDTTSSKKPKRGKISNLKDSNQAPTKRSRKSNSRNSAPSSKDAASSKPEEVRRSKFLERNRVAASKCRQKKKEWTQNLEDRGRELHKDNNSLRMMVDSFRQEVLFLKGEMLRHSACGDPNIHDYLQQPGTSALSGDSEEMTMKRESSPFESMPSSRMGSVGTTDLDAHSVVDEEVARQGLTHADIARDENALEALLTSSINHDTSEEGIANHVGG